MFAALTLLAVSLQKTYQSIPLKELKHRAREGDTLAAALHKAASYEHSLEVILWAFTGVSAAAFFFVVSHVWTAWFAILASAMLVWLGFFWVPTGQVTRAGMFVARYAAPVLAWALNYLHPTVDWIVSFIRRHRPVRFHTGLYDKEDILSLLHFQRAQVDSRISPLELELAERALRFGDVLVRDVVIPRRVVRTIAANEAIGPVLMAELHASGFSRFPVTEGDAIVGILYLRDLSDVSSTAVVKSIMRGKDVSFVHEEQALPEALSVMLATHRQLLVVVNSFEEYVGIVTLEDVMEQIIGRPIVDEFDAYDDMRAVAAKAAAKEHRSHSSTKESTEVVK